VKPYGLKQHEKHAPRCPCCDNWDKDEGARHGRARAEAREAIRAEIRRRLANGRRRLVSPDPPPRYDDVFFEGTAWLDKL
jgi:hypothetical protein